MRRDWAGWDCGGVSRNLLWACDKIRSGRLIERRSGEMEEGKCRRAVSPRPFSLYKYAKGINSFKNGNKCE